MPEETSPAGKKDSGAAQAEGLKSAPTGPADSRKDSGNAESESGTNRDAVWAEARRHYEAETKKAQSEAAELRKRLEKHERSAKTAEQLQPELDAAKAGLEERDAIIKDYAEQRVEALREDLREALLAASEGSPLKMLKNLPKFEKIHASTQLKTLGGSLTAGNTVQLDFNAILQASDRGDSAPMRDAVKKVGQQAYNLALRDFMMTRGRR